MVDLRWPFLATLLVGCGGLRSHTDKDTSVGSEGTNTGPTLVDDTGDNGGGGPTLLDDTDTTPFAYDDLLGRTYALDLTDADWVEPAGLGLLIEAAIEQELLAAVTASSAEELAIIGAVAIPDLEPVTQDPCTSSVTFPVATFADAPTFSLGPKDVVVPIQGLFIVFEDLELSGEFAEDLDRMVDLTLQAVVDTRPLVDAIDPGGDESSLCDLAAGLGGACQPCADGSGTFCLPVHVEDIAAPESATEVTEVEDPCGSLECQGHGECV